MLSYHKFDRTNDADVKSKNLYCWVSVISKRTRKVSTKKVEGTLSKIHTYINRHRNAGTLYSFDAIWVNDAPEA